MTDPIDDIIAALAAMSATAVANEPYYVKHWFRGEPGGILASDAPACAVIPTEPYTLAPVFVGEDTETVPLKLRFYQIAARDGENPATAPAVDNTTAQFNQARALLRAEPTLGGKYVSADVRGTPLAQTTGDFQFRTSELTVELKRRVLWGA